MQGLCPKCNKNEGVNRREMADVEYVVMKNGRHAAKGRCAVCGGGMYKIVSAADVPGAAQA